MQLKYPEDTLVNGAQGAGSTLERSASRTGWWLVAKALPFLDRFPLVLVVWQKDAHALAYIMGLGPPARAARIWEGREWQPPKQWERVPTLHNPGTNGGRFWRPDFDKSENEIKTVI